MSAVFLTKISSKKYQMWVVIIFCKYLWNIHGWIDSDTGLNSSNLKNILTPNHYHDFTNYDFLSRNWKPKWGSILEITQFWLQKPWQQQVQWVLSDHPIPPPGQDIPCSTPSGRIWTGCTYPLPHLNRITNTCERITFPWTICYAASGTFLAFTRKDSLVKQCFNEIKSWFFLFYLLTRCRKCLTCNHQ